MKKENPLLATILAHLKVITNEQSTPAQTKAAIEALDEIYAKQNEAVPSDLRHFLNRHSYQKAVLWIEESGPIPRGICGRGQ
ncbi:MAG: hypothetical protein LBV12_13240 [Puniceicoccales bacterium]|jgi:hypothetical protein|nr:hypothetical protein [Puniceicoccales bacterium]